MTANQVSKLPVSDRERCEQDIARVGIAGAMKLGWPVDEVRKAVDRIVAAHGSHEGIDAAAEETAARYSGITHEYRNYR